jgi:AraC family transcriptional regulator of adaptative response/methylated-DNA-[protein]-cysteine methyltransferase
MNSDTDLDIESRRAWRAVLARDRRADGRFLFGVRSTGIFCRPSCPARRPARRNVVFFARAEAARAAGYRPCRRCRPEEFAAVLRRNDALLERACRLLESEGAPATLAALARAVGARSGELRRLFRERLGVSPRGYAEAARFRRLKRQLRSGRGVSAALFEAGFGSTSRVYERADTRLGMTPATYGKGGKGMEIIYAVVPAVGGSALVGWTARGVCAVTLGADRDALVAELRKEYPGATFRAATAGQRRDAERLIERARHGGAGSLAIDVEGTAFQWRVWQALREIPAGETRSYSEIAGAVGRPRAVRAVASACASNRVALVIPCHRAVRADGGLGGYRWGLARKRALLEAEGAQAG